MTTAGKSHHEGTCARTSRLATTRATTTAAAMVQSSPTMKLYQNRKKPTIKDTMPSLRGRAQRYRAPPPQRLHIGDRDDDEHGEDAQDRQVRSRPINPRALGGPEGAERREQ